MKDEYYIPNLNCEYEGCSGCSWEETKPDEMPCEKCIGNQSMEERDKYGLNDNYYNAIRIRNYSGTVKDTAGKPNMMLQLTRANEAIVRVREYGLRKYPNADNWKGIPVETWIAAAERHIQKWIRGIDHDEESGKHHLDHALCDLAYAVELLKMEREIK